jgi:hypothetical protein
VKTAPVLDVLLAIGSEQGGTINPAQLEQVKKVPALGGSLTFSGADQLERIYLIWKDAPKLGSIDRSGLAFSSPDNILFMESVQDWSSIASDEYVASLPPEIRTALEENQIDLKAVPAMFGADATFVANWPNGAMFPSALFSLGITDRGGVEGIVRRLIENYLPDTTVSSRAGATVFEFPKSGLSLIDPTVGISDKFLIGSLTSSGLDAALMRNPSQPTIEASPAFQNVSGEWKNDLQSFIFIDARTIFERVYNSLRPMVIFGAAMSPGISQTIDVEKLPETDVIAKHLGPIVMTQRVESNGVLIESRGPVTLYQSIILIGAGAGGAAAAQAFMQPR